MATFPTTAAASPLDSSDDSRLQFTVDTTETLSRALDNMPTDFASMDTLSWTIEYRAFNQSDDGLTLYLTIETSDESVVLAAQDFLGGTETVESGITNATDKTVGPTAFNYVNTSASKADWDDAVVYLTQAYSRNMGGDSCRIEVDYFAVTGTYTTSSTTQDLTPSALSVSPTFPTATLVQEQFLTATLLTIPTTFPFATINQQIQGALLSLTPTFPTGEIKPVTVLASTLVSLTPSFPQAQLNQGINASLHSITVSFPTATIGSFTVIQGVLASLTASFGTATVTSTYDITPARLDVGLSFPGATVEGAGTVQDIQPTTLSLSPSFPTAKMGITLLGSVLTVGPSFGTATIGLTVKANTLGVLPTFPISDIDPVYDIPAASVQLFPTFGTAVVAGDQALTPDTLVITAIFPSGNLTFAGTPLTPIDTEGQGIAQEMCAARGLSGDLDWLGSLNALNGGTDLDKLGVLHALGATPNADLLLSLEQLAFDGQGPGDFNELMRRWAESGNF